MSPFDVFGGVLVSVWGGIAAALVLYVVWVFNRLVQGRNACVNARASIDVNLTRRHQLIPNLVSTVSGYTDHERTTLEAVTRARSTAIAELGGSGSPLAEAQIDAQLARLAANVEAYPDLKADALFINLMRNLTEAEEQISASRRAFNGQVMRQNNLVQQFPTLLVAKLFGFVTIESYSADAAAHEAARIRFDAP